LGTGIPIGCVGTTITPGSVVSKRNAWPGFAVAESTESIMVAGIAPKQLTVPARAGPLPSSMHAQAAAPIKRQKTLTPPTIRAASLLYRLQP
jgi:hypothetical protein